MTVKRGTGIGSELVGRKWKLIQQNVPLFCGQGMQAHQIRPDERYGQHKEWQGKERKGVE